MKTTIEMARESWIDVYGLGHDRAKFIEALKHFEALVRADEREIEREACAKVCSELYAEGDMNTGLAADLIRARGNT